MKRSARIATLILLAGLVQVFLPSVGLAQSTPWEFKTIKSTSAGDANARVSSQHVDGGHISFACTKGKPKSLFLAFASTKTGDEYPGGDIKIAWRIDGDVAQHTTWKANTFSSARNGVVALGQDAFEFALAVARAQNRVVFRNENGTAVFDVRNSTKAIAELLEFCELEQ